MCLMARCLLELPPEKDWVAIIGSRSIELEQFNQVIGLMRWKPQIGIVSGGAKGVDSWAERWAAEHGYRVEKFLPEWDVYGKAAGFKRNAKIIQHANAVFAVWDGKSKGTYNSMELAKARLLPVQVVKPEVE